MFEKICIGVSIVIFLAVTALWIFGIKACSQLNDEISQKGLKSVIEEVWEGPQK